MQKVGDVLKLRRTCISSSMSASRNFHITLLIVRPTADITEIKSFVLVIESIASHFILLSQQQCLTAEQRMVGLLQRNKMGMPKMPRRRRVSYLCRVDVTFDETCPH